MGRPEGAASGRLTRMRKAGRPVPDVRTPNRKTWTPEQDAQLASRYREGATLRELSGELGCSANSVDIRIRALRKRGVDLAARSPRWTPEKQAHLARRYREGATYKQLGLEFGKTKGTISRQLRRLRDQGVDLDRD
jgi:biotin operon repressor